MLKIVEKSSVISEAQVQFESNFKKITDSDIPVTIGYPGGNFGGKASWMGRLGIWLYSFGRKGRHINLFGIGKPAENAMIPITCEINFPRNGINRRVGGAFAVDDAGEIVVIHRGKIGGGRKGIGKILFENNYRGALADTMDGTFECSTALIGTLKSTRFPKQVQQFVFEVERIKKLRKTAAVDEEKKDREGFTEEFAGKKKYTTGSMVEAACDHGLIVNALASTLQESGHDVRNDRNRDLFIIGKDDVISTIFEIKTSVNTTDLYSAIGQLLLNSIHITIQPRLILIIPERLSSLRIDKLLKLGIDVLPFKWKGNDPIFPSLSSFKF